MKTVAIIPAAGSGKRVKNATAPKQFLHLGGRELLEWTVKAVAGSSLIDSIIIIAPPDRLDEVTEKYRDLPGVSGVVPGGDSRNRSVFNGVAAAEADFVAIHDAARPFVTPEIIDRAVKAAHTFDAATVAVRAVDTLKWMEGDFLGGGIDREKVLQVQTPQVFRRALLLEAWEKLGGPDAAFTDETGMLTELGKKVAWVEGSPSNVKVTTRDDLNAAALLLSKRQFN